MYIVNPVLLIPEGVASEDDVRAVRTALQPIQAWYEAHGVYLLILDPKAHPCSLAWQHFATYPGGPYFAVQDLAIQEGWRSRDDGETVKALVFLQGFRDGEGEAGLTVAVVGYGAVADLASAANDGMPSRGDAAAGLVAHEIGHLMGLQHVAVQGDLMHEQAWSALFPAVTLSERPVGAFVGTPGSLG